LRQQWLKILPRKNLKPNKKLGSASTHTEQGLNNHELGHYATSQVHRLFHLPP
jgi:hypothetical protein